MYLTYALPDTDAPIDLAPLAEGLKLRDQYDVEVNAARALQARKGRHAAARAAITAIWTTYLARMNLVQRLNGREVPNALTAAELELTKKALLGGITFQELSALPVQHPEEGSALSGRWNTLVDVVLNYGFEQIAHAGKSLLQTEYWLRFVLPNGYEHDERTRTRRTRGVWGLSDLTVHESAVYELKSLGFAPMPLNGTVFTPFAPVGRPAVLGIPQFAYCGSWIHRAGLHVGLHFPNAQKVFPKRPFKHGAHDDVWIHTGPTTILISNRSTMDTVGLSSGNFPMVFVGPHAMPRFVRALALLQQLVGYTPNTPIEDMAAYMACQALAAPEQPLAFAKSDRTSWMHAQHELFWALKMDRAAGVLLTGTAAENGDQIRSTLAAVAKDISNL